MSFWISIGKVLDIFGITLLFEKLIEINLLHSCWIDNFYPSILECFVGLISQALYQLWWFRLEIREQNLTRLSEKINYCHMQLKSPEVHKVQV